MKKKIMAILLASVMTFALVACGETKKPASDDGETEVVEEVTEDAGEDTTKDAGEDTTKDTEADTSEETSEEGGVDEAIVGSWKYDGMDYTYTFNADGTGNYAASGTDMPFTFTTNDGNLEILYEGNTAPMVSTYTIEGDCMTMKDSFDSDVKYYKQ